MDFITPKCLCWTILLAAVLLSAPLGQAVSVDDCIAEKFFRYSSAHTACILKSSDAQNSGVDESTQTEIVDKHNELRALQTATNMQKMVWDDEIASIAQRWTDNCAYEHDEERRIPGRFSVGQNLAAGYSDWDSVIQAWYDEISDFTYGSEGSNVFSDVGHYTQVVWAGSVKIGCGYTYCTSLSYKHFYACNYGPAGNLDWWEPYSSGSKCADCSGTCSNNLCDCNGKVCENGGDLDLETCECTCSQNWHLPEYCALNCSAVEESANCEPDGFYDGKCSVWSNVPDVCPETCNICPYADATGSGGDGEGDGDGDGNDDKSDAFVVTQSTVGKVLMCMVAAAVWLLNE